VIENSSAAHLPLHKTAFFQLIQVIGNMLPAPTIDTTNLRRVVFNLNPLKDRDYPSANSTEVKFDF
jgi:hypothetical protein